MGSAENKTWPTAVRASKKGKMTRNQEGRGNVYPKEDSKFLQAEDEVPGCF